MAIKSRLLSKLKFTYMTTTMAATAHPQKLRPVLHNLEEARELCQQGLTESNYAKYGEVYDGVIMAIKQILSGEAGKDAREIVGLCKELLEHIMAETGKEEHFKKEMVFLPYKASMWDSLESVWRAAYEDKDNCLAYVIPIPYCDRNPDGTAKEWHCERDLFPQDVPTLDWQEVDLKAMHPDVIFFHYPYDNCNKVTSTDEAFYSRNLKECADKLVYIPYFVLGEPEFDYDDPEKVEEVKEAEDKLGNFILEPGVLNADMTIVQSEAMRKVYVNVLNRHTNAPEGYWEEHILGLGSPKFDKVAESRKEDFQLPEEWERIIKGKKTVLYNTGLTAMLEHTDKYLEKLKSVLDTFKAQQDVVLWWRPHPLLRATFASMHPELLEEYDEIVDAYRRNGWGIYDETAELERAVAWTDGYYGDGSSVVQLYEKTGKFVAIQLYEKSPLFYYFCKDGEYIWFVSIGEKESTLCKININNSIMNYVKEIPIKKDRSEITHVVLEKIEDKVIIAPYWNGDAFIEYDICSGEFKKINIEGIHNIEDTRCGFTDSIKYKNSIYFVCSRNGIIVEYKIKEKEYICHTEWSKNIFDDRFDIVFQRGGYVLRENVLFLIVEGKGVLIKINLDKMDCEKYIVPDNFIPMNLSYDGKKFIFTSAYEQSFLEWDIETNIWSRIPIFLTEDWKDVYFFGSVGVGNKEYFLPFDGNEVSVFDKTNQREWIDSELFKSKEKEKRFILIKRYKNEVFAYDIINGYLHKLIPYKNYHSIIKVNDIGFDLLECLKRINSEEKQLREIEVLNSVGKKIILLLVCDVVVRNSHASDEVPK